MLPFIHVCDGYNAASFTTASSAGVRMDGAGMAGLTYYATNDDDPYITLKGEVHTTMALPSSVTPFRTCPELQVDDEEEENIKINPHDNLIVCGKAEGDMSTLDIHVYNAVEDTEFIHHSILLSAFPLAVEWLDYDPHPETRHGISLEIKRFCDLLILLLQGNYVAVGTMNPLIEVWDLDVVNEMEPVFVLGAKPKKSKSKRTVCDGHE